MAKKKSSISKVKKKKKRQMGDNICNLRTKANFPNIYGVLRDEKKYDFEMAQSHKQIVTEKVLQTHPDYV